MDAVSASALSQAGNLQQAGLIAARNEARSQEAIAALLQQQVQQAQQTVTATSNSGSVDTYA